MCAHTAPEIEIQSVQPTVCGTHGVGDTAPQYLRNLWWEVTDLIYWNVKVLMLTWEYFHFNYAEIPVHCIFLGNITRFTPLHLYLLTASQI